MKRSSVLSLGVGVVLASYVGLYLGQPGGPRVLLLITDICFVAFAWLAAALALKATRMFEAGAAARWMWLLLSAGMLVLGTAELLWTYYNFLDQPVPFPSTMDILWAIGYLPVMLSLLFQYRTLGVQVSRRRKLTVLALYLSVLVIAFIPLLGSILPNPGQVAAMQLLISAYYLIGNLSVAFVASLSLLFLGQALVSRPWQYIFVSILLFALAGLTFSYGEWSNLYETGRNFLSGVVDVSYMGAYLLAAAGGYRQLTLRLAD
ncbi:MAG TPA: hypothetical protein VLG46_09415 [Anaerolineae bacterium]|nr:hypothetical protein [Anaerolineae bacterium]